MSATRIAQPLPLPERPSDQKFWGDLPGASAALAIANAAGEHPGLVVVLCPTSDVSERLRQEIEFFLGTDGPPVLTLPEWETLPYDNFSPHQDIVSERLSALVRLPQLSTGILLLPVSAAMQRLAPRAHLQGRSLMLDLGQHLPTSEVRRLLEAAGYRAVDNVYEHGEFAVRGSVIDLYPMGATAPYRIDLFDDEIESLRVFDPDTQRTTGQVDRVRLLPAHEFPLDAEGTRTFRANWYDHFDVAPKESPLFRDVLDGIAPPGIEYYLPLFFDSTDNLFDYLPANTMAVQLPEVVAAAEAFWEELRSRYAQLRHDRERPVLAPEQLFLRVEEAFQQIDLLPRAQLRPAPSAPEADNLLGATEPADLSIDAKSARPLHRLQGLLEQAGTPVLIAAESAGRRESLLELLARHGLRPQVVDGWHQYLAQRPALSLTVAPLSRGLQTPSAVVVSESQLFGQRVRQRQSRTASSAEPNSEWLIKNLTELQVGAPVVHLDHGVGRYLGLQTLAIDGAPNELLTLEYAGGDKLYVPVANLHLISRYSGAAEAEVPLNKLGTDHWAKAKRKAAEKVRDAAAELLDIYARRAARPGHAHALDAADYQRFAADFPFEETDDQARAIEAVIADMRAPTPMDRLICGDVGFGKTEVAMRAAFMAISNQRQVVVLVPTTLLAEQHFESFRDRFADWPVRIESLSRFRTAAQQEQILTGLKSGQVDIVIGTHKLLQKGVAFGQLGLVIIDEEHRFGVRHKERLKALRAEVDILTLTATPIPRTLNMAMSGMRDLSVIATPPAKRLSIKTFVRRQSDALVHEAIVRELHRGGQVFYLHNEVKTIDKAARELQEIVPQARIGVAHGQMRERELEQVMSAFYHKRFNVLVCTTIIETGIDIPTANTMVIERADRLGLAQLHQLRGRVGRSHHQAYAYLLVPEPKAMTPDARKRLDALEAADTLGAGFTLASHDLEIRGAGDLLGEGQSGHISEIGFSLYMEMLERAVKAIREGKTPDLEHPLPTHVDLNLRVPALIPDDYLPDVHSRLVLYKRIANAKTAAELDDLKVEMIDRFGLLPTHTQQLFAITALKLKAEALGIARIDAGERGGVLEFAADTAIDPLSLVQLVQAQPDQMQLKSANELRFNWDPPREQPSDRIDSLKALLARFQLRELDSDAA